MQWWEGRRPRHFTLAQHLTDPEVNCQTDAEVRLARACAKSAKERIARLEALVNLEWVK